MKYKKYVYICFFKANAMSEINFGSKRFDDIDDSKPDSRKNTVDDKSEIIKKTIEYGNDILNKEILPYINKVEIIKQVLNPLLKSLILYKLGWRIQFTNSKEWAGLCSGGGSIEFDSISKSRNNKSIFISLDFVKKDKNWEKNYKKVIIHEVAHAVVRECFDPVVLKMKDPANEITKGHGLVWDAVCKALSKAFLDDSSCDMFYTNANFEDSFNPYVYECFSCGNVKYGKSPSFATKCSVCRKSVFVEKNNN